MSAKSVEKSQHKAALASMSGLTDSSQQLPKKFIGNAGGGTCLIKTPSQLTNNNSLDEIFVFARNQNASDVHISSCNPIIFRKHSALLAQTQELLTKERVEDLIRNCFSADLISLFLESGDLEFIHTIEGAGRFRVTLMLQRQGWDLTARIIPLSILPFEKLGLPESCKSLTKWSQGLVLVTGPVGCGKTTTLSTLVDMVNSERQDHIITIEQPIEIVYSQKKCQITQREIHTHTLSQANALKASLREDPDIIVVSELRDLDSIHLAVTAAETGHLVFGTMNTTDAAQTISSLIDSFPADEQSIIANMISESLRGIICQQLIPRQDNSGVVAAYEVLMMTPAISNMIRERKIQQITNTIATGKSMGMVLFDNSLKELLTKGLISLEEAQKRAISPQNFTQEI